MNADASKATDSQELAHNSGKDDAPRVRFDEDSSPSDETAGTQALDPTRYGDWEMKGRCIDF